MSLLVSRFLYFGVQYIVGPFFVVVCYPLGIVVSVLGTV